jgi:hypothetical protein
LHNLAYQDLECSIESVIKEEYSEAQMGCSLAAAAMLSVTVPASADQAPSLDLTVSTTADSTAEPTAVPDPTAHQASRVAATDGPTQGPFVPASPNNPRTTIGNRVATGIWTYPVSTGGSRILWYQVQRGVSVASRRNVAATRRSFQFTNLANGHRYPLHV